MSESDPSLSTLVGDSPLKRKRGVEDLSASQTSNTKRKSPFTTPPKMMNATKKLSLSKPQSLVTFIVGNGREQQVFSVHKTFATAQSSFFDSFFNTPGHEENTNQTMELLAMEPERFGSIVHWLYFQEVEDEGDETIDVLFDLWEITSTLEISTLQKYLLESIKQMFLTLSRVEQKDLIKWAYCDANPTNKLKMAPLRKLVVEMVAWGMEPEKLEELKVGTPQELWVDLAMAMSNHVWDRLPTKYFGRVGSVEEYMCKGREIKKE